MRNLLILMFVLGLTACASHTRHLQDVYEGQTMQTTPTIALPADMNRSDIQDYYRIPDVVHKNYNAKAKVDITPPQI